MIDTIREVQTALGLVADGQAGPLTWAAIRARIIPEPVVSAPVSIAWPAERDAEAFYGARPSLTEITPPYAMRMFYDGAWHPITKIKCHVKVAASLRRILDKILARYETQANIQAVGLDVYDGCYNNRSVRGDSSKRSMHAYGAAIDFDADHNQLGATVWRMPAGVVKIFMDEGWRWGGNYTGRKDAMHFEACT